MGRFLPLLTKEGLGRLSRLRDAKHDTCGGAEPIPGRGPKIFLLVKLLRVPTPAEVAVHHPARSLGAVRRAAVPEVAVDDHDIARFADQNLLVRMRSGGIGLDSSLYRRDGR